MKISKTEAEIQTKMC